MKWQPTVAFLFRLFRWCRVAYHRLRCNLMPHGIEINYMYSDLGIALLSPDTMQFRALRH